MAKLDAMKSAASLGGRPNAFPPGIDPSQAVTRPKRLEGAKADRSAMAIELGRIIPDPNQPRKEFEPIALAQLAASIAKHGVLQPIRVRWDEGQGVYVVLMGGRRLQASRDAGKSDIPCIVHDGPLSDAERLALQVVENALRDDLRPIEQANAYRALMDLNGWNAKRVADELNLSPASMTRALSLLGLPPLVQEMVEQGAITPSAAAEVAKLDDAADQIAVAQAAAREDFARDQVADLVKAVKAKRPSSVKARGPKPQAKAAPVVWDTDEFKITIEHKIPNPRPLHRIAGDLGRWARSLIERPDAKLDQPAGQAPDADAA